MTTTPETPVPSPRVRAGIRRATAIGGSIAAVAVLAVTSFTAVEAMGQTWASSATTIASTTSSVVVDVTSVNVYVQSTPGAAPAVSVSTPSGVFASPAPVEISAEGDTLTIASAHGDGSRLCLAQCSNRGSVVIELGDLTIDELAVSVGLGDVTLDNTAMLAVAETWDPETVMPVPAPTPTSTPAPTSTPIPSASPDTDLGDDEPDVQARPQIGEVTVSVGHGYVSSHLIDTPSLSIAVVTGGTLATLGATTRDSIVTVERGDVTVITDPGSQYEITAHAGEGTVSTDVPSVPGAARSLTATVGSGNVFVIPSDLGY